MMLKVKPKNPVVIIAKITDIIFDFFRRKRKGKKERKRKGKNHHFIL